ncbi:MAG TPA: hypothetical protein DHV36_10930 [Desulfobacteraceae bacterium]|nr:hypothetical protein [Desulfobacteraceae bacterium]
MKYGRVKPVSLVSFIAAVSLLALLGLSACSGGPDISESLIESEFRHAWYSIHGKNGEKGYRWKLVSFKPGKVELKKNETSAIVSIFFTYTDASGKEFQRRGKFTYLKKGKSWELEDRFARSTSSSTRYQITP